MLIIIFKIILCSSLLIGIYYMFLQREKMFRFNRFYLLLSLAFSYAIPFVKINLPAIPKQKSQLIFDEIQTQQLLQNTAPTSEFNWVNWVLIVYGLVAFGLIIKALFSILKIINLKGKDSIYQNQKVRLIEQSLPPFSFWNKIYLSQNYFENQQIDNRIFLHEKTHLVQKHSLDLIFIEFLQAVSWFNPAIFFFKKAIITNHEFLADEVIVKKDFNVRSYQHLILSEVMNTQNISLINPFNFNNTKLRFIMMTTQKSKLEKVKKILAVTVFTGASILFVQKVYATETKLEVKTEIPEISEVIPLKLDTIPSKKIQNANVKIKSKKNQSTSRELKENELPIPPPPPPARDITAAEFPEGLNALRKNFQNEFDSSTFGKKDGTLKTNVYITIDENGKTKDVKAEGPSQAFNNEAVRTLKLVTQDKLWKPATEEGKAAATVFQFPITMQFR